MEVEINANEEELVSYVQNILKCQILPMDYMNLRNLVKQAPQAVQFHADTNYPGQEFLTFLYKYPAIFNVNRDRTITIAGTNYCTLERNHNMFEDTVDKGSDEIEEDDRKEYVSDESDEEVENEKLDLLSNEHTTEPVSSSVQIQVAANRDEADESGLQSLESETSSFTGSSDYFCSDEVVSESSLTSDSSSCDNDA